MSERNQQTLRSSRIPHSAPGEWKDDETLRECALLGFPESHVRILRSIFPALFTIYGEEDVAGDPRYCGSYTKGQLRAVVQDLRYTARFLAMVARMAIHEESETDRRLGWLADRLAVHVEKLAGLVEERIVPARKRRSVEGS